MYVRLICSIVSSSKSAAGTACSASKPTSSCSNYADLLAYASYDRWERDVLNFVTQIDLTLDIEGQIALD
jgi:hypothetical protein